MSAFFSRLKLIQLNRRSRLLLAVLGGAALLLLGVIVWQVERSLNKARSEQGRDADLGVVLQRVNPQANPGFEALGAPAVFKSAAIYEGRLYVSGPEGLSAYTLTGALERVYRVGMELPTAPLGKMSVGLVTGAQHTELLIATAGAGVVAFDGSGFRQILPKNEDAKTITALLPLSSGRLLLGTARLGVLVFDGKTLKRFHPTLDNIYVTALAGSEASLSVGTLSNGLLLWQGGETVRLGEEQGLPDSRVESLARSGESVFAGTPMGVAEVRQGKVVRTLAAGAFAHALLVDGDELFVGQMEAQITRLRLSALGTDPGARRPIQALPEDAGAGKAGKKQTAKLAEPTEARLTKLVGGPAGGGAGDLAIEEFLVSGQTRYALTGNALLAQAPGGEWRRMLASGTAQLSDRNVSSLAVTSDGRLWVGFFDRGLDIVSASGGQAQHVENEQVFCVNRIVENTREASVAVATANGLVLFSRDGRQRQVLGKESGLIAQHVTDVVLYREGMVLATPAGVTFLDAGGAHSMYAFQGLVNNHVYALGAGGNQLVVGTLGGISLVQAGQVQQNLTVANSGLKHNWITALAPVGGDWLVGTYGGGIERLSGNGQVTATDVSGQGIVVNPGAMASDASLVVAGTLGRGLLVGDGTGGRWRTVTAGLPSLNVTAVAISHDTVWVGTENGLVKIARNRL